MEPIKVWAFEDAPKELQALSQHGGDEDWLILIPASYKQVMLQYGLPTWMLGTDSCNEPSEHVLENGDHVIIGAHA
jgi:hypothetical protein